MDSNGMVVLPPVFRPLYMFAFLVRVSLECTSLEVSCTAARMMIKVGVIA